MAKKKSPAAKPQEPPPSVKSQSEPSARTSASPGTMPSSALTSSPSATSARALHAANLQSLAELMDAWLARHRRPPALLYHYTSAQGLHGMLSTGRVWGTNVGFLNDPSEMRYAARLIRGVMAEEANLITKQQPEEKKKDGLRGVIEKYFDTLAASLTTWTESLLKSFEDQGDAYMTCFCTKGDLLSQWRGYGATGGGYALGFDARQIGTPAPAAGGVLLRRVIYKPKEQQEIVRQWVRAFLMLGQTLAQEVRQQPEEAYEKPKEGASADAGGAWGFLHVAAAAFTAMWAGQRGVMKRAASNKQLLEQGQQIFTNFLAQCLICFKDPAYAEEQEWRVIQFGKNAPAIKFRPSGPRLVPYLELALTPATEDGVAERLPLKSITYGPTLEPEVTEKSLTMLLKHYKYQQPAIEIKRSGIPFRT